MLHPDGELLALGMHFIEQDAEALRAEAAFEALLNQVLDDVKSVATWPANQDEWTREDAEAYCNALKRFSNAAGELYRGASKAAGRAWARRDRTAGVILASNPKTPEGLAIKALVRCLRATKNRTTISPGAFFNSRPGAR
jgi:hypothetical protein